MASKRRQIGELAANKRNKAHSSDSESSEEFDTACSKNAGPQHHSGDQVAVQQKCGDLPVGRLLVCGGTNWDLIGRKELPKSAKNAPVVSNGRNLWGPHRTKYKVKLAVSGCTACHSLIVTEDGRVMTWGRNDHGQLGHGDTIRRDEPTEIESLRDLGIIGGAVGRNHTLFLTSKGQVYACGENKSGQLGVGNQTQSFLAPVKVAHKGKPIVKVACGAEFSLIVDCDGGLYSFGYPQYGQLGHNTEAKYFASGNRLAYKCEYSPRRVTTFVEKSREGHTVSLSNVRIVDVACGINHSVAIDNTQRCFTWGFGGYGRLGHSETKDELVPRLLKYFDPLIKRGVKQAWCGGTFSMAVDANNLLYFWGQTKMSGEAAMYPKNVQDLNGWNVRSVGCANKSIVLAADESVISWGPSPTYGELGLGDNQPKSAAQPQEAKPLNGIYIQHLSTGYGHTLFVAREQSPEESKQIDKLPEWP